MLVNGPCNRVLINLGNKQTDHMLMCSQGPGTRAQFLLGGTPGCSPMWGGQSEVSLRSEHEGGEGEGGVCRGG